MRLCIYCGVTIRIDKRAAVATDADVAAAILYRESIGKPPVTTARHLCESHRRHPPQYTCGPQVRKGQKKSLPTMALCGMCAVIPTDDV
jgi:hypothetical protein